MNHRKAVIGNSQVLTPSLASSAGFSGAGQQGPSNPLQLISWQGVGHPERLVVTLGTIVRQGSPGVPYAGSPALANYQAPNIGQPQCRLQWGAGGIRQQTTFAWPVMGGSFGITAESLSLDAFASGFGAWATPAEYPVFSAWVMPGDPPANPMPMQSTPYAPAGLGAASVIIYRVQSSFVQSLYISAQASLVATSTNWRLEFANEALTVLRTVDLTGVGNNSSNPPFIIPWMPGATRYSVVNADVANATPQYTISEMISFA